LRADQGPVAVLTLNRPEARNCLSEDLIAALHAAIAEIGAADAVRAVVITGAGSAFSSGHDLKELSSHRSDPDRGKAYFAKIMDACSQMMLAIVRSPKPVIAAVNGIATAAGCQLVATCDLAVASEDARFATPGVNIGLFCSTPMVALSRNLSRKAAMEMLLLGDMVAAKEAKELGLVNRVVKPDETVNAAVELGRKIAEKPKATLKIGKETFYRQLEMPLDEAYAYASAVMVENMLHDEAKEGIGAFLEKRQPRWPPCPVSCDAFYR
jgi:enoyl-CoA hydratase/carnithine racemase